jgi:hypothetical protein
MNQYLVKLVFNINIANESSAYQFDEQLRIVEAYTTEDAFFKAKSIGKNEEESFVNKENEMVTWQFIDVADIYPLGALKDGELVYSTTRKIKDNNTFIQYIRQKSMEIQAKNVTFV